MSGKLLNVSMWKQQSDSKRNPFRSRLEPQKGRKINVNGIDLLSKLQIQHNAKPKVDSHIHESDLCTIRLTF